MPRLPLLLAVLCLVLSGGVATLWWATEASARHVPTITVIAPQTPPLSPAERAARFARIFRE